MTQDDLRHWKQDCALHLCKWTHSRASLLNAQCVRLQMWLKWSTAINNHETINKYDLTKTNSFHGTYSTWKEPFCYQLLWCYGIAKCLLVAHFRISADAVHHPGIVHLLCHEYWVFGYPTRLTHSFCILWSREVRFFGHRERENVSSGCSLSLGLVCQSMRELVKNIPFPCLALFPYRTLTKRLLSREDMWLQVSSCAFRDTVSFTLWFSCIVPNLQRTIISNWCRAL